MVAGKLMQPSKVKVHRQHMYAGLRDCNLGDACLLSASYLCGLPCSLHCPALGHVSFVFFTERQQLPSQQSEVLTC